MRMRTEEAVAEFGNKARLARALGIHRASVTLWGEYVPLLRQYQIRELLEQRKQAEPPAAEERAA